ncbi:uncharacterized protein LOC117014536 [Rhinolophus ferrumequinum]|uniref:uncharacterized protein LOC117014536 n=1 Tax=Rhinolophus ferrumequinum TaxID=59479 RepID=UPI00140F8596|nr:uncharacterized protein LOC117014536 [Rhinolophus ferrumequinum]
MSACCVFWPVLFYLENALALISGRTPALVRLGEDCTVKGPHLSLPSPPYLPAEPVPLPPDTGHVTVCHSRTGANLTLECRAEGASEFLNVTWWHSDVPRKWQQRGTLGPGSSAWPLAVSLPLEQLNTSFTCAVSNQVDRKTATTTLGDVCARYSQGQATGRHVAGIAGAVMVVLLTVVAGLYFWKKRGKKKEMEAGTGAGLKDGCRVHEDGICYAELSQQVSQEGGDKGVREQPLEGKIPVTTIYSEVHRPGQAAKVI